MSACHSCGSPPICTWCGHDNAQDRPISRGPLEMVPYGDPIWHGEKIKLWPSERAVLWTLLKAHGIPLKQTILAERAGYERDYPTNIIGVYCCRIRHKFAEVAPIDLHSRKGMVTLNLEMH